MADRGDDRGDGDGSSAASSNEWRKLKEEVTCFVCKALFVEPKTVSCLHTFCRKCIQMIINNNSDSRDCPVCKAKFALPQDHTKIPTNSTLQLKADMVHKRKEKKCGECDDDAPTVMWCVDCENYLCTKCNDEHKRMKRLRSHETMTVEQFNAQGPNMVVTPQPEYRICKHHSKPNKQRPLDFYCTTCNILICQVCVRIDHHQHHYDPVNQIADEERCKIKDLVAPLETMLDKVTVALKKVEDADNELNNETDAEKQVQEMYHQLHQMLEQCEVKDLEKVKAAKDVLQNSLSIQKENLRHLHTHISSCSEFVSKVVMPVEEISELQEYNDYTQEVVNDLTNQVQQSSLEPVRGVDDLILSTSNPNDYTSHFASLCKVSTFDFAHIQQESTIISRYGPNNRDLNMSYFLAVGPSDELICRDFKLGSNTDPRLVVFNKHLRYSHIIGDGTCKCPTGIAVNKEGCIYVTDFLLCKIFKFIITGELVGEIGQKGSGKCQFKNPRGLLLSSAHSGLLFVCDSENDRIQVLQDDKFAYSFGKQGTNFGCFNCPVAAALTDDEDQLFVSDCHNHRIQVFTTDGRFLKIFGNFVDISYTLKRPYGICCSPDGHVLIVSRDINCVLIFDRDGQFVSAIEGTYRGRKRFSDPIGVVMRNNGQIVVAAHGSHNLTVF